MGSSCVTKGYPLAKNGTVQITKDVATDLYATETFDAANTPEGTRQTPYFTGVTLQMNEGAEPPTEPTSS